MNVLCTHEPVTPAIRAAVTPATAPTEYEIYQQAVKTVHFVSKIPRKFPQNSRKIPPFFPEI